VNPIFPNILGRESEKIPKTANNRLSPMTFTFCYQTGLLVGSRRDIADISNYCSKVMNVRLLISWPYTRKIILDGRNGSNGIIYALTAKREVGRGSQTLEA